MPTSSVGFSLIELLITLTIIGILSSLSYPLYTQHIKRSYRLEAKTSLIELASDLEHNFLLHHTYKIDTLAYTESAHYDFQLSQADAQHYSLTATPKQPDEECAQLSLNDQGWPQTSGTRPISQCW